MRACVYVCMLEIEGKKEKSRREGKSSETGLEKKRNEKKGKK